MTIIIIPELILLVIHLQQHSEVWILFMCEGKDVSEESGKYHSFFKKKKEPIKKEAYSVGSQEVHSL